MRILVTGSAGFVGSHICDALLAQGHEVYGLDAKLMGVDFTPTGVTEMRWRSYLEHVSALPEGVDAIVHAAARADISNNWSAAVERDFLTRSNVLGTQALLEGAAITGRHIPVVFLSTLAVYGDTADCSEGRAVTATSPYAASKIAGEALVQAYAEPHHGAWHVLRLGCVVGARYHHGHIADFVRMQRSTGIITSRSEGLVKKSFVHVADVVDAVSGCLSGLIPTGVYNCASGTWCPRDTVALMGPAAVDASVWPVNVRGWVGDPMAIASGQRLKSMGWVPRQGIRTGVIEALASLGWR